MRFSWVRVNGDVYGPVKRNPEPVHTMDLTLEHRVNQTFFVTRNTLDSYLSFFFGQFGGEVFQTFLGQTKTNVLCRFNLNRKNAWVGNARVFAVIVLKRLFNDLSVDPGFLQKGHCEKFSTLPIHKTTSVRYVMVPADWLIEPDKVVVRTLMEHWVLIASHDFKC